MRGQHRFSHHSRDYVLRMNVRIPGHEKGTVRKPIVSESTAAESYSKSDAQTDADHRNPATSVISEQSAASNPSIYRELPRASVRPERLIRRCDDKTSLREFDVQR